MAQHAAIMGPEILDNLAQSGEGKGRRGKAKAKGKGGEEMCGKGQVWEKGNRNGGALVARGIPAEQPERGRGRSGAEGSSRGGVAIGVGSKWVPRSPPVNGAVPGEPRPVPLDIGSTMVLESHQGIRRHDRRRFQEISDSMRGEQLTWPEVLSSLGNELPIFREVPSVELTP